MSASKRFRCQGELSPPGTRTLRQHAGPPLQRAGTQSDAMSPRNTPVHMVLRGKRAHFPDSRRRAVDGPQSTRTDALDSHTGVFKPPPSLNPRDDVPNRLEPPLPAQSAPLSLGIRRNICARLPFTPRRHSSSCLQPPRHVLDTQNFLSSPIQAHCILPALEMLALGTKRSAGHRICSKRHFYIIRLCRSHMTQAARISRLSTSRNNAKPDLLVPNQTQTIAESAATSQIPRKPSRQAASLGGLVTPRITFHHHHPGCDSSALPVHTMVCSVDVVRTNFTQYAYARGPAKLASFWRVPALPIRLRRIPSDISITTPPSTPLTGPLRKSFAGRFTVHATRDDSGVRGRWCGNRVEDQVEATTAETNTTKLSRGRTHILRGAYAVTLAIVPSFRLRNLNTARQRCGGERSRGTAFGSGPRAQFIIPNQVDDLKLLAVFELLTAAFEPGTVAYRSHWIGDKVVERGPHQHSGDFLAAQGDRMKTSDRCFPDLTRLISKVISAAKDLRDRAIPVYDPEAAARKRTCNAPLVEIAGTQDLREDFRRKCIQASRSSEELATS
ncbi:hypothetical protein EVG20_g1378 [Dentipellis fragilis]|uniref:Uncharacterized protein n=1 Tax=Dentipellis fragilis TaxID=205917 RepID=A0A4Y9ZCU2_9AGAM|nr:hypothetical protein EVG20_g1378 [Dentipellis fragilis]